jgi:Ni/Fe-hydrogenase subunit HybB-like protein
MSASLIGDVAAPDGARIGIGFGQAVADAAIMPRLGRAWLCALAASLALCGLLAASMTALFIEGVGVWGNNIPVTWALDIVSYDWWIGIACGGLLLASVATLWEKAGLAPVRRIAALISVAAAIAAGLYPIIHLGRPWLFYWNLPYPNTLLLWPQFRSPLVWDAFDILGFLVVSVSGLYVGMLPDLAMLRDRAIERMMAREGMSPLQAQIYGIAALGWRGSAAHWNRQGQTTQALAILGLLMVATLQSAAAIMFAGTQEPGWHDPLLPAAFIVGAAWQGVAVSALVAVALRWLLNLQAVILERHLARLAWLMLALGLAALVLFCIPFANVAIKGSVFEKAVDSRRFLGAHSWSTWSLILCALLPVHVFWLRRARRSPAVLAGVALGVCFGIFGEHFMVIVVTLQQDFLPAMAHPYAVDGWGLATFFGTMGLFLLVLLLAVRYVPMFSLGELRRTETSGGRVAGGL